jgi:hypothetical protein
MAPPMYHMDAAKSWLEKVAESVWSGAQPNLTRTLTKLEAAGSITTRTVGQVNISAPFGAGVKFTFKLTGPPQADSGGYPSSRVSKLWHYSTG